MEKIKVFLCMSFKNKTRLIFWFLANIILSYFFILWFKLLNYELIVGYDLLNSAFIIFINAFLFSFISKTENSEDEEIIQNIEHRLNGFSLVLLLFTGGILFTHNVNFYLLFGILLIVTSFFHFLYQEYCHNSNSNYKDTIIKDLTQYSTKTLSSKDGGRQA